MGGYYYITQQGDTWDYIAWRVYGDEYMETILLQANPQYLTTYLFEAGCRLWCPEAESVADEEEEEEEIPEWRRDDER